MVFYLLFLFDYPKIYISMMKQKSGYIVFKNKRVKEIKELKNPSCNDILFLNNKSCRLILN